MKLEPAEAARLREVDKRFLWHPFTPLEAWCAPDRQPLILTRGEGVRLWDSEGNAYIDGNSSIWTNLHGHNHPRINAAIRSQLDAVAHTSFLGFTNPPAIRLAEALIGYFPEKTYGRIFLSDNGSTAVEVAIKMAIQYWQIAGFPQRRKFAAFSNAYHGDTLGAASLGGIPLFHERFQDSHFPVHRLGSTEELIGLPRADVECLAGVVIEPMIQGAAGMRLWPQGMLAHLRRWCDQNDVLLIADEIMTGFGRTGKMFACEHEAIWPDFLALAKGISGGYLPVAATLIRPKIVEAFEKGPVETTTFFYGHSYTGNALGCAAALASWQILEEERVIEKLRVSTFSELLVSRLSPLGRVSEIRSIGLIAGVDVAPDGKPLLGARVCQAARCHGLLTRPIRDTIVLMPPLCIEDAELETMIEALRLAILEF